MAFESFHANELHLLKLLIYPETKDKIDQLDLFVEATS